MRADLKEMVIQVDELDVWHLRETIQLCESLNTSHWQHTHAPFADLDMENHEYVEALSDQNFRTAGDVHYIWQLGLWRLQAIFEGLIDQHLLRDSRTHGLRRKLKRLADLGRRSHDLPLRHLIDSVDVVHAFDSVQIALMDLKPYFQGTTRRMGAPLWLGKACP